MSESSRFATDVEAGNQNQAQGGREMETQFSSVEEPQTEATLQPEPEEESAVVHEARPSGPRPSILKVSARSRPSSVAGAIAGVVRETGRAEVQSIGAGATNQAVKAVAIARSYLQEDGIDIVCIPSFAEVMIEQEERTAIRLVVEKR
jgi:stage V sporulation protein S